MPSHRASNETDKLIGLNLRRLRLRRSMSMAALGDTLGVAFQQVQKYETGLNRISVSTLLDLCAALNCDVQDFLEGVHSPSHAAGAAAYSKRAIIAANAIDGIASRKVQSSLIALLASIERSKHEP